MVWGEALEKMIKKNKENVRTGWQKEMTDWMWEEKEKLLPDPFLWK